MLIFKPIISCSWRRINGTNTKHLGIDSNRLHLLSGSMQIRSVTVSDTGTYQCIVNNTVGEEKQEVELKVTGK